MESKMTRRTFIRKILTTPNFFFVFAKHLDEVFPDGWIYEDIYEGTREIITSIDSTYGWVKALKQTCEELELLDCWECWDKLEWFDSDKLDGDIGDLLVAIVYDENGNRIYYPYE